ncbi:MAG: aminoacyl-tRNA deacylase [Acidimicrobiaceae bacterium]|nr:aminoacyl-tRNA deacylase [Acidimicrobiaceae bacterium]|tara:strand:- start:2666 stop:3136 length:471 start_codon:yes stop_codon:yes gene_type:complete
MTRLPANDRFRAAAEALGIEPDIVRFSEDTRTAAQAAAALGCDLGQIIKSLVFQCDGEPVLALTAGDQQVDTQTLGELCGGIIEKAGAETVRDATGFAIGGVPPFGHMTQLRCFVDRNIGRHETVWGAAGTPDTVFSISSSRLVSLSGGQVTDFVI